MGKLYRFSFPLFENHLPDSPNLTRVTVLCQAVPPPPPQIMQVNAQYFVQKKEGKRYEKNDFFVTFGLKWPDFTTKIDCFHFD